MADAPPADAHARPPVGPGLNTKEDNHGYVTIPSGLLREVYGRDRVRDLLLLIKHHEGIRYSEARRTLDLHPQQFQRALDRLETRGLVGMKAPAALNNPDAKRDYHVVLELTGLGEFCADLWESMNEGYDALLQHRDVSGQALAAAAGEE